MLPLAAKHELQQPWNVKPCAIHNAVANHIHFSCTVVSLLSTSQCNNDVMTMSTHISWAWPAYLDCSVHQQPHTWLADNADTVQGQEYVGQSEEKIQLKDFSNHACMRLRRRPTVIFSSNRYWQSWEINLPICSVGADSADVWCIHQSFSNTGSHEADVTLSEWLFQTLRPPVANYWYPAVTGCNRQMSRQMTNRYNGI